MCYVNDDDALLANCANPIGNLSLWSLLSVVSIVQNEGQSAFSYWIVATN